MRKLSTLAAGEVGTITAFDNNELLLKLLEMGCLPGEKIRVEQIAPLGDPISVLVSGYTLSLRLNEAEGILVQVDS